PLGVGSLCILLALGGLDATGLALDFAGVGALVAVPSRLCRGLGLRGAERGTAQRSAVGFAALAPHAGSRRRRRRLGGEATAYPRDVHIRRLVGVAADQGL